jgi:tyrosine-protein phosphatase SIW14
VSDSTLVKGPYDPEYARFMQENGIRHVSVPMSGNKEPFGFITDDQIAAALNVVLDPNNAPVLIHCNKGKVRICP